MGTIAIEAWEKIGGTNSPGNAPIYNNQLGKKDDATTSTTAKNYVTPGSAGYISVYVEEKHRVSLGGNTTGDGENYTTVAAGERRDIGLRKGGEPVYYRTDT